MDWAAASDNRSISASLQGMVYSSWSCHCRRVVILAGLSLHNRRTMEGMAQEVYCPGNVDFRNWLRSSSFQSIFRVEYAGPTFCNCNDLDSYGRWLCNHIRTSQSGALVGCTASLYHQHPFCADDCRIDDVIFPYIKVKHSS